MKLYTAILEKFIDIPNGDPHELRLLLDDLGLEVKDVESVPSGTLFTIETLANRGDHLYALGVAREISARLLNKIKLPAVGDLVDRKSSVVVRKETALCMRYALLEMHLPKEMTLRDDIARILGKEEANKKHPIVDILNYTQLEFGQPMHAFDKDKIDGEIIIDTANEEERVLALDGKEYVVPTGAIRIRDRKKTVAIAGVIGLANSMVTEDTTRVLLESAAFDPISVRKTARTMGISTDASYAFERGSDRESVLMGLKRVVHLCESAQVIGLSYAEGEPLERRKVKVRLPFLKNQINLPRIQDVEITARLKNLGYGVEQIEKELLVTVPSWRVWDVENEADIIEDFARSHGLSDIKIELPPLDYEIPPYNDHERVLQIVEPSLVGNGFFEVITRSFYSAEDVAFLERLDKGFGPKHIQLKNSIESGYSHLKQTNLLHFAQLAANNSRMGVQSIKIFEYGRLFGDFGSEEESFEMDRLCIAAYGRWYENDWRKGENTENLFFLFKGLIDSIAKSCGRRISISEGKNRLLHAGAQGAIISGRETIGFFGVAHPLIRARYDLKGDLLYAEFDTEKLARVIERPSFEVPSDLPAIKRDITLQVAEHSLAGKVVGLIDSLKIEDLTEIDIVDDFKRAEEAFRRVSYRLTFRNKERTLEHQSVDAAMQSLLKTLQDKGLPLAT